MITIIFVIYNNKCRTLLCYVFGFSSGFSENFNREKCNSSEHSRRIHHFQTEYTTQEIGEDYDNLTITEQPQRAIQYNGELSLPTAQAHVEIHK